MRKRDMGRDKEMRKVKTGEEQVITLSMYSKVKELR